MDTHHCKLNILAGSGVRPKKEPDFSNVLALPRRLGFGSREKGGSAHSLVLCAARYAELPPILPRFRINSLVSFE